MFNKIVTLLDQNKARYTIHKHEPIRTVQDALEKWPYGIDHLVKTVAFKLKDGRLILAAVRAKDRIDYKKLADHLGISRRALKTLSPTEVHDLLGVEPGAVSPIATESDIQTILDNNVLDLPRIFCGMGRVDRTLEISASELQRITQANVCQITKSI